MTRAVTQGNPAAPRHGLSGGTISTLRASKRGVRTTDSKRRRSNNGASSRDSGRPGTQFRLGGPEAGRWDPAGTTPLARPGWGSTACAVPNLVDNLRTLLGSYLDLLLWVRCYCISLMQSLGGDTLDGFMIGRRMSAKFGIQVYYHYKSKVDRGRCQSPGLSVLAFSHIILRFDAEVIVVLDTFLYSPPSTRHLVCLQLSIHPFYLVSL